MPELTRRAAADALRRVIDPEVGLNVVDLGLVYDVWISGGWVEVTMTMTTPACPMSSYIVQQARGALLRVPGVQDARVELVWQPNWSPEMMDPEARRGRFGLYR